MASTPIPPLSVYIFVTNYYYHQYFLKACKTILDSRKKAKTTGNFELFMGIMQTRQPASHAAQLFGLAFH